MRYCRARLIACIVLPFVLLVLAISASAQKIKVEFDKSLDFSKFKTYTWAPRGAVSRPLLADAIAGAIEEELAARGLQQVTAHPDLYVEMYGSMDSDMAVSYSDLYSGYGGVPPFDQSFMLWGAVPGSTTTVVVHKGQLVVDIIDASQKKLAWRGIARDNLSDNRNKLLTQVNTAVEKMFKKYPVPRAGR